jgi:hypothetical protein
VKPVKNERFISFASKVKLTKPTLSVPHLIYGVKQCTASLKVKEGPIKMVIIFYDERYSLSNSANTTTWRNYSAPSYTAGYPTSCLGTVQN